MRSDNRFERKEGAPQGVSTEGKVDSSRELSIKGPRELLIDEHPIRRRLSPEQIEARITWRVAELEVLAAQTALNYAQMRTREAWAALYIDMDD